jgi:hypothetical protein
MVVAAPNAAFFSGLLAANGLRLCTVAAKIPENFPNDEYN